MEYVNLLTQDGYRTKVQADHVKCRTRMIGHDWDVARKIGRKSDLGTLLSFRCARCGMWRHDVIGAWGQLVTRNYDQPDGYHLTADEQPTGDQLRLALIKVSKFEQSMMDFDEDGEVKTVSPVRRRGHNGTVLDLVAEEERERNGHSATRRVSR